MHTCIAALDASLSLSDQQVSSKIHACTGPRSGHISLAVPKWVLETYLLKWAKVQCIQETDPHNSRPLRFPVPWGLPISSMNLSHFKMRLQHFLLTQAGLLGRMLPNAAMLVKLSYWRFGTIAVTVLQVCHTLYGFTLFKPRNCANTTTSGLPGTPGCCIG